MAQQRKTSGGAIFINDRRQSSKSPCMSGTIEIKHDLMAVLADHLNNGRLAEIRLALYDTDPNGQSRMTKDGRQFYTVAVQDNAQWNANKPGNQGAYNQQPQQQQFGQGVPPQMQYQQPQQQPLPMQPQQQQYQQPMQPQYQQQVPQQQQPMQQQMPQQQPMAQQQQNQQQPWDQPGPNPNDDLDDEIPF